MTDTIAAVLRRKGSAVCSVPPDASVYQAIETMADRHVGALLVMQLEGYISGKNPG